MSCVLSLWPLASSPQFPSPSFQAPAFRPCLLPSLCCKSLSPSDFYVSFVYSDCSWARINGALLVLESMNMYSFGRQVHSIWVCPTTKASSDSLAISLCVSYLNTQSKENTHIWYVERACSSPEVCFISRDWKDILRNITHAEHTVQRQDVTGQRKPAQVTI